MVNASKILTVSYGTFSCTLEGFDDPFSTMRSIAEYFRDLAADDRYFGAEPPTPDAEMLHRIAEREIQRRVEAKVQDNGIVLRQVDEDEEAPAIAAAEEPPAPAEKPQPTQAPAVAPVAPAAPVAAAAPAAPVVAEPVASADVPQAFGPESVAAKLARIRAAVSRSQNEPQLGSVFPEDEHAERIEPAVPVDTAFLDTEAAPATESAIEETADKTVVSEADGDAAQDDAETTEAAAQDEEYQEDLEIDEAPDVLDIAGLAPSKADAAEEEAPADEDETETADEAEQAIASADEDDLGTEEAEAEADLVDEAAEVAEEVVVEAAEDEADQPTDAAGETAEDELDLTELLGDDRAAEADEAPESPAAEKLVLEETDRVDADAVDVDIDLSELLDKGSTETAKADEGEEDAGDEDVATADDTEGTPRQAPRVRVMKMSRKEFEARFIDADADEAEVIGDAQPDAQDPSTDAIREALGETGLSKEDEAELVDELLAVERDAQRDRADAAPEAAAAEDAVAEDEDGTAAGETSEQPEEAGDDKAKAAADLAAIVSEVSGDAPVGDDVSVDRLLAQADTELENKEGSRRRSAIAHLKAAVAAVRADGGKVETAEDAEAARTLDQFRDDLASVVRPEAADDADADTDAESEADAGPVKPRPAPRAKQGDAAETARPRRKMPPLMLVSEQRIDKPDPAEGRTEPVRPRRVHADDGDGDDENELFDDDAGDTGEAAGNMFSDGGDFARFVTEHGAEGLQDLLEASAAFGAYVEGDAMNSRPQIMQRVVRYLPKDDFTREEGLRAFGVLLREGRIKRVERGQFTIAPSSRFKDAQKSATG
ncbi:MAG: hypothetical protein QNJ16_17805 [Rhodobacter sp.]|nr:hypothetical protein [Rhodobacter sp.]